MTSDMRFMVECLVADIITMRMREAGLGLLEAFAQVYRSRTFEQLCDERTGLYCQGPVYVYEVLLEELGLPMDKHDKEVCF